ncbi:TPA: hypothetical protein HA265_03155 [Candidatus Woesearchaeota archaeon]|nr:hypothetical protein [Candidatus Woesearchaeota archaeon]
MKKLLSVVMFIVVSIIISASLMLSGCSGQEDADGKVKVKTPTKEEIIMGELDDGKLIAVFEKRLEVPSASKQNRLAIRNAYDKNAKFLIEICQDCKFSQTEVEIAPQGTEFISFQVNAVPGEKTVVVRDEKNNFYAKDTFIVTN